MNALSTLMIWWAFFAIATVIVSSHKHRSDGYWFMLGCLFGPAALLAVSFLPEIKPEVKAASD